MSNTHDYNQLKKGVCYSSFGSPMPGRHYASANGYRYGFNGKEFEYNSQRQRVLKIEKPRDATIKLLKPQQTWVYTYYTYDASGNVMGVYKRTYENNQTTYLTDKYELSEFYLYGSSLLGSLKYDGAPMATRKFNYTLDNKGNFATVNYLAPDPITPVNNSVVYASRILGKKLFDGSNHLGNVLVKYSDRKLQDNYGVNQGNLAEVDFYTPDIYSHTDYYPFGSSQAGRSFHPAADGRILRGFNGKEDDVETGNQNYGMRIYNSNLGRFLSVDPLTEDYPMLSTYQFASNSPIFAIDVDGLEGEPSTTNPNGVKTTAKGTTYLQPVNQKTYTGSNNGRTQVDGRWHLFTDADALSYYELFFGQKFIWGAGGTPTRVGKSEDPQKDSRKKNKHKILFIDGQIIDDVLNSLNPIREYSKQKVDKEITKQIKDKAIDLAKARQDYDYITHPEKKGWVRDSDFDENEYLTVGQNKYIVFRNYKTKEIVEIFSYAETEPHLKPGTMKYKEAFKKIIQILTPQKKKDKHSNQDKSNKPGPTSKES